MDLVRHLNRFGVSNSWDVARCLLDAPASSSDDEIFSCLSKAKFEQGHGALALAERLGELRAWLARVSSAVAVSGERFRNAANRLQLWMWLRCECGPSLRAFMSSTMRWRSGL
ncbi:MAG TPA: hypothetical protein VFE34_24820, partial [Dongiaceae bacterium]|nr:hypothetical protein [Dongiaceae bacterium]